MPIGLSPGDDSRAVAAAWHVGDHADATDEPSQADQPFLSLLQTVIHEGDSRPSQHLFGARTVQTVCGDGGPGRHIRISSPSVPTCVVTRKHHGTRFFLVMGPQEGAGREEGDPSRHAVFFLANGMPWNSRPGDGCRSAGAAIRIAPAWLHALVEVPHDGCVLARAIRGSLCWSTDNTGWTHGVHAQDAFATHQSPIGPISCGPPHIRRGVAVR